MASDEKSTADLRLKAVEQKIIDIGRELNGLARGGADVDEIKEGIEAINVSMQALKQIVEGVPSLGVPPLRTQVAANTKQIGEFSELLTRIKWVGYALGIGNAAQLITFLANLFAGIQSGGG